MLFFRKFLFQKLWDMFIFWVYHLSACCFKDVLIMLQISGWWISRCDCRNDKITNDRSSEQIQTCFGDEVKPLREGTKNFWKVYNKFQPFSIPVSEVLSKTFAESCFQLKMLRVVFKSFSFLIFPHSVKMILKGQKRKLPQEDLEVADSGGPVWERQRQFVFSVSLNKYQRSQELPEPSLRRSVLIANTLRQMSLEGCREPPADMEVPETPPSAQQEYFPHEASAVNEAESVSLSLLTCPAGGVPSSSREFPMSVEDDEDWESADSDVSLSAAISSILTALDSTIDGNSPRTPLRSLENLSGSSEVASVKLGVRGHGVSWQQADQRARDGGLSDVTVEDLFQDIDTCLLERDMGGLGLGGHQAGDDLLRYLPPFSLNPNLKCLPSFSSFSPLPAGFPPAAPSSMSAPSQSRETFELDNLMEILVESWRIPGLPHTPKVRTLCCFTL